MTAPTEQSGGNEMDAVIEEYFARNLRELEADKGHALAPGLKQSKARCAKSEEPGGVMFVVSDSPFPICRAGELRG